MNILIITPYLPYPLSSGGAQAVFNMVDNLRSQHNYTMIINEGGQNNAMNREALKKLWPNVDIIYYPFTKQLLSPSFVYEKTRRVILRKCFPNKRFFKVESILRPYGEWFSAHHISFIHTLIAKKHIDMVQVEFMESIQWIHYLPINIKKIFVHHELGFVRKERLLSSFTLTEREQKMLGNVKRMELEALNKYDAVITVTDIDKNILKKEGIERPIYTSNLAVNTKSFPYSVKHGELTFVGGHGHYPNKEGIDWFETKVAPLLKDKKIKLNLIGTNWPAEYERDTNIEIELKGFVKDLSDIALGNIMIVPILSGSGMRMKILEAAAMSMPILTTSVGVEGLEFKNNESCIIEDTPEGWASAIMRLNSDPDFRKLLGVNANRIFKEKYSPAVLADKRNEIYKKICD